MTLPVYLICGSRDFKDADKMTRFLSVLPKPSAVICGMADGADLMGRSWAILQQIPVKEFPADWKQYGRAAGPIRNQQMLKEGQPTLILGFPTNPSAIGRGTAHMLSIGSKAGVPTYYAGEKEWLVVGK